MVPWHTLAQNRRQLDVQANDLQRTLSALQAVYNDLAEISILPDNILSDIFLHLYVEPSLPPPGVLQTYSLPRVAEVCRHWRRVAFNTPWLWTYIIPRNLELAALLARRSGELPVTISLWDPNGLHRKPSSFDRPQFANFIGTHCNQIAHLFLAQPSSSWEKPLRLTLPNLESVEVSCRSEYVFGQFGKPQTFELIGATKIRSMILKQIFMPWKLFSFIHLRHLELYNQVEIDHSHTAPSMETFLDVLESCTRLEYLRLEYSGPTLDPDLPIPPPLERKVVLPHLRRILLRNEPRDMSYLLQHIQARDDVSYILYFFPEEDFSNVGEILPKHIRMFDEEQLKVYIGMVDDTIDECWESLDLEVDSQSFNGESFILYIDAEESSRFTAIFETLPSDLLRHDSPELLCVCDQFRALFRAIPQVLPTSTIALLEVSSYYSKFTEEDWRLFFTHYPMLQAIVLQYYPLDHDPETSYLPILLDALNGLNPPETMLCPEFEGLDILDLIILDDRSMQHLRTFLQARANAGCGLRELTMNEPQKWKGIGKFEWPKVEDLVESFVKEGTKPTKCEDGSVCSDNDEPASGSDNSDSSGISD